MGQPNTRWLTSSVCVVHVNVSYWCSPFLLFSPGSNPARRVRVPQRATRKRPNGQTPARSLISQWLFFTFFFFYTVTLHLPPWQQPSLFRNSQSCLFFLSWTTISAVCKIFYACATWFEVPEELRQRTGWWDTRILPRFLFTERICEEYLHQNDFPL